MSKYGSFPFSAMSFGSILVLLTIIGLNPSSAFFCYKCTSNENDLCVNSPSELAPSMAIECEGYCTILRTEFTDIPGQVLQLQRDCSEEEPLILNDIRTDKHYTKMYTSCTTDRCNSGDGKRDPGTGSGGNSGPSGIIIVNEQSSSNRQQPTLLFVVAAMFIYSIFRIIPTFCYKSEHEVKVKFPEETAKSKVICRLKLKKEQNLERFLVAPEKKNIWTGGIRSQCEGVLSAKTYTSEEDDRGVYTVIPEIDGSRVTVDAVYKMWLALECAMMRRESLIIVEDAALANVTKFRTEQWRLLNRFVWWGSSVSILLGMFFTSYPSLHLLPLSLAIYGYGVLNAMKQKDPASRYSECCVNKQYELDPESSETCDAKVSMKYLRSTQYRMFKLEDTLQRDKENKYLIWFTVLFNVGCTLRGIYNYDYAPHVIRNRTDQGMHTGGFRPLNIFNQIANRFITFGNSRGPGRADLIHWSAQNALFYYFFIRHIPRLIQAGLEYVEHEHIMEISIRYLQFRNLEGEERYEFPARNLYRTMQKDYPTNRILKEMYDHFHEPDEGYYESEEFLTTRQPYKITLKDAIRQWKIAYYRKW
ncbi:hypothetical protein Ocin01_02638 [Orchesella cincta]|uniref:Protein quiver n=1 Tax=Orchesella cincta TaxID=48709 RepID=A0A1D2NFG4_ORCCI|nr:hypothetical protein Ocin01_02638 [Orchesella cincta]